MRTSTKIVTLLASTASAATHFQINNRLALSQSETVPEHVELAEVESVGVFQDTWFSWGMHDNDDIHLYYWFDWTFYCYGDYLYVWDPCYWEEWGVDGWNWYWDGYNYSGFCMGYLDDTWYAWGYDMDWYTFNGDNYYCYQPTGYLYKFNPDYWVNGWYYGWTWYDTWYWCAGYGQDMQLAQTQDVGVFQDTWFSWGMKDNDDIHLYYWFDWTFYCYGEYLYVWDPCYWEHYGVDGWNWYWDGYNYSGFCMDYIVDTWYSWGYDMDWYTENGDNFYCYYGNSYIFDPAAWDFYPGWTWVWNGTC